HDRPAFVLTDYSAAAFARRAAPGEGWCGCRELHPDFLRGGEVFWLLNHNREIKRAGSVRASGPCHFNKEQTPLASLRYQPAVSRRLFRCLGAHLLRSPSIVKAFQIVSARAFA